MEDLSLSIAEVQGPRLRRDGAPRGGPGGDRLAPKGHVRRSGSGALNSTAPTVAIGEAENLANGRDRAT